MKKILLLIGLFVLSCQASAYDFEQIQIHGFASQGYLKSNNYNYLSAETKKGTFEFNEFGFNISSNLGDRLRLGMQVIARDLGDSGNDALAMDWAFGDYRYRNWLGFRAGKMKKAFGLYNQSRDIDAVRTGVFLPLSVYAEGDSRIAQQSMKGVSLYGSVSGGLDYQIQYGTLDSAFEENLLKYRTMEDSASDPDALSIEVADDNYVLHLSWSTPIEGFKLVGSFNHESWAQITEAEPEDVKVDFDREAWILGGEYMIGNLTVAAEYSQTAFEIDMNGSSLYEWTSEAYYGLAAYRFTGWFELGTSYSVIYSDKDDKEGTRYDWQELPRALGWSKDLAITTRFDLSEAWIVKLEGHWMNGLYSTTENGGASTNQDYGENPEENGFLGAVKVTFSF